MGIVVKVDFTRFDTAVKATEERLDRIIVEAATEGARKGADYARKNHRHRVRTGTLTSRRNLFHSFLGVHGNEAIAAIIATAPYVRFIEFGAPAHPIEARNAPLLVFMWEGRLFIGRRVNHPGIARNKFMFIRPAAKIMKEEARRTMIQGVRDLAREVWS